MAIEITALSMVTILLRLTPKEHQTIALLTHCEGNPQATGDSYRADVAEKAWYHDATLNYQTLLTFNKFILLPKLLWNFAL